MKKHPSKLHTWLPLPTILILSSLALSAIAPLAVQAGGLTAANPRALAAASSPQVIFVTDVSGSMGYYVLSKDLPQDLAIMQQQLEAVQDNPEYTRLTDQLDEIAKNPQYEASIDQYNTAVTNLNSWLVQHGYEDTDSLHLTIENRFKELGCELGYQELYEAEDLNDARSWVDDACKYASASQADKQSLLDLVAFLGDQE